MTIQTISFRDFTRGHIPADVLMLLDKKTNRNKGLFVKPEYTQSVIAFLKEQEKKQTEQKKKALLDFVGAFGNGAEIANLSHAAIKARKYE